MVDDEGDRNGVMGGRGRGDAPRPSRTGWYGALEVTIWVAADHVREFHLDERRVESVLYHELCHFGRNDEAELVLVAHEWAGFASEIEVYGLLMPDTRAIAPAFKQARLDGVE